MSWLLRLQCAQPVQEQGWTLPSFPFCRQDMEAQVPRQMNPQTGKRTWDLVGDPTALSTEVPSWQCSGQERVREHVWIRGLGSPLIPQLVPQESYTE